MKIITRKIVLVAIPDVEVPSQGPEGGSWGGLQGDLHGVAVVKCDPVSFPLLGE